MTGVERLMSGDGEHAFDGLSDDEQNLALIISGQALAQFCDSNERRQEDWGIDEATWAQWIANGREVAVEVEDVLEPWLDAWLAGKA
jgi:hypothetical protein